MRKLDTTLKRKHKRLSLKSSKRILRQINQKEQRKECEGKHKKARTHGGPEILLNIIIIIIYGVQNEENDSSFVRQMLTDINSETTPKSVKRIGKNLSRNRPLKVGFASVAERDDVLGKLHKLKNKDHYLRINITEDLTEDERTWFERAKEKNNKEPQAGPPCGDCEENQIRDFI